MLRCADNSIYTGMTNDLDKRINEHLSKDKNGAKYTKSHNAVKLDAAWKSKDKSLACKLEYQIKTLSKMQKEALINGEKLSSFLSGKVDCRRYKRITIDKNRVVRICLNSCYSNTNMVEATGIEPATSWSQTTRATNCATPRFFSVLIYYTTLFLHLQDFFQNSIEYF